MVQNFIEHASVHGPESEDVIEYEGERFSNSMPNSPNQNSRPTSMIIKKVHTIIPAHLVAEAISTLHGVDLRWSGPITPTERQYVQQYVFAKYPEYSNALLIIPQQQTQLKTDSSSTSSQESSPKKYSLSTNTPSNFQKIQLDPSKLLDILTKKTSPQPNFISIPEIQARNRALQNCGLSEEDYLVVFTQTKKEALTMVGESYPFFKGNYYMTILDEEFDYVRGFVSNKESKLVAAPESWLDLRIKGSQLSQYFRRKCKFSPKGLFAYSASNCSSSSSNRSNSMHWISEAHRNDWHVLLDASGLMDLMGTENWIINLELHRPDFVVCVVDLNLMHSQPSRITCLLVRKKSFDTAATTSA